MGAKHFLSLVVLSCLVSVTVATNAKECGIVETESAGPIASGNETARGKWPWLVALFQIKPIKIYQFLCDGSLISAKHVLSGEAVTQENIVLHIVGD